MGGLSEDEFWDLTITEIVSICEFRERQHLLPAAMICSLIANVYRDEKKQPKPFQPADFLPGEQQQQQQGMTKEQWIAVGKAWHLALGGSV